MQYLERTDTHCKIYVKVDGKKKYVDAYPQFFQDAARALYLLRVSQFNELDDACQTASSSAGRFAVPTRPQVFTLKSGQSMSIRFGLSVPARPCSSHSELAKENGLYNSIVYFLDTHDVGDMVNDLIHPLDFIDFDHYEESIVKRDGVFFYSASYTLPPELGDWPLSDFESEVEPDGAIHRFMLRQEDRFNDFVGNNLGWKDLV